MKYSDEMTLDQSPKIVSQVTKTVSDVVKEKNTSISLNFTWHNHLGSDNDTKNDPKNVIKQVREVISPKDISFRNLAKQAIESGIEYKEFILECRKAYLEYALETTDSAFDAAQKMGIAHRTGVHTIIRRLDEMGYMPNIPEWLGYKRQSTKRLKDRED